MNPSFSPSQLLTKPPAAPTPRPAHKLLPASPQPRTRPAFRARLAGFCGTFAAGFVLITAVAAQPPSKGTPQPAPPPTVPTFSGPTPVIINVDFPGGTVAEYCDAIRAAAAPTPVNILMNDEAASVVLPRLSMKQVSLDVALKAMSVIERPGNMPPVLIERLADGAASAAYVLKATGTGRSHGLSPRHTRVHSLRSIVEPPPGVPTTPDVAPPVETVMAALTAASRVDDNQIDPMPDLMLHKESLVLVCRGTEDQQDVIASVLKAIESDVGPRRIAIAERTKRSERERLDQVTIDAELKQAENALAANRTAVEYALKRMQDLEIRAQGGLVSKNELELSKQQVSQAQANVDSAQTHLDMLQARRHILEARNSAAGETGRRLVIYNIAELEPFNEDIARALRTLVGENATVNSEAGSIHVAASPAQHAAIRDLLLMLRRIKANDPRLQPLPGSETPGDDAAPR
jgi:hypothetical protein